jgi:putative ABC transport system permease protein
VWDTYFVDADFMQVLGMEVVQGRSFSAARPADSSAFVLNEAALKDIVAQQGPDWEDPVGKHLDFYLPGPEGWNVARSGIIIGVVKDFNYRSLHAEIGPLVMQMAPIAFDDLIVKVGSEDLEGALAFLEAQWQAFGPPSPFEFEFLDKSFEQLYLSEQRTGLLFGTFATLAIVIACLGLLGLAALMAEQRTKEVGVRKVLGASVPGLVALLSKDFLLLVGIAFVVAAPVTYLAAQRWLEHFAYHIDLHPLLFAEVALIAFLVALLTVGTRAYRAARLDPARTLRYE